MLRTAPLALVLVILPACAGYCPVDHSGLQAPALWGSDGRTPTAPGDHGGGVGDPGPRR